MNNSNLKFYLNIFYYTITYGAFAISVIAYIYIIATRIDYLLDSDMSSEIVLAKLIFDDKSILIHDWHYSSEIRVIYMQLFMAPLFLFTSNWHVIRVTATIMMATVFMLSLFFFMSSIQQKKFFPLVATFLLLPFMPNYFWHIFQCLFYNINIVFSLLILGLYFYLLRIKNNKNYYILVSILAIISFITGLCGIRNLINIFIPSGICVTILWIFNKKQHVSKQYNRSNLFFLVMCVIGLIGTIGYVILTNFYSVGGAFGYQNEIKLTFNFSALLTTWNGFLIALNLPQNVFTNIILLASFALLLFLTVKKVSPLKYHEKFLILYFGLYILIYIFIYCFTDMFYSERYFTQITTFFPILVIILFTQIGTKINWVKYLKKTSLFIIGMIIFTITLHNSLYLYSRMDSTQDFRAITQILLNNNCYDGYMINYHLKRGSEITELSNGKINIRPYITGPDRIDPKFTNIDIRLNWLTSDRQYATKPEGKVFVAFGNYEYDNYQIASFFTDHSYLVFDDYGVKLFIYNSYDEMISITGVDHNFN